MNECIIVLHIVQILIVLASIRLIEFCGIWRVYYFLKSIITDEKYIFSVYDLYLTLLHVHMKELCQFK